MSLVVIIGQELDRVQVPEGCRGIISYVMNLDIYEHTDLHPSVLACFF